MKKYRIALDVKEQIINRIKNEGVTVAQAAKEHGVSEASIYTWLGAKVQGVPSVLEMARLKRENDELLRLVGKITLTLSEAQKKK
ncbi:MAG: transposase [Minisyncoccota bacterium]